MNRHLRPRLPLLKGQRGNCPLMSPLSGVPCVIQQRTIVTKLNDVNNEPLLRSSITSTANRKAESLFTRHSARTTSSIRTRRHHSSTNHNCEGRTPQPITTLKAAPLNQSQTLKAAFLNQWQLWRQHPSTNHNSRFRSQPSQSWSACCPPPSFRGACKPSPPLSSSWWGHIDRWVRRPGSTWLSDFAVW